MALIPVGVKKRKTNKGKKSIVKPDVFFPKKVPKFIGHDFNQTVALTSPYIYCINQVVQGTSNDTRIGSEMLMTSIQYKATICPNSRPSLGGSAACVNVPAYAISIVYDRAPQGSLPSISGATTSIFNGSSPHDLPLFDMSDRYVIVLNELFTPKAIGYFNTIVSGTTSVSVIDYNDVIEKYRKISLRTKFNSLNNGNVGDINIGALYLVVRCSEGAPFAYDNRIYANIDTRVRFKDV